MNTKNVILTLTLAAAVFSFVGLPIDVYAMDLGRMSLADVAILDVERLHTVEAMIGDLGRMGSLS